MPTSWAAWTSGTPAVTARTMLSWTWGVNLVARPVRGIGALLGVRIVTLPADVRQYSRNAPRMVQAPRAASDPETRPRERRCPGRLWAFLGIRRRRYAQEWSPGDGETEGGLSAAPRRGRQC